MKTFGRFVSVFALAFIVCASTYSLQKGDNAPRFANPDLEKHYVLSADVLGKGWLLIDFFATYCEPCKKELPEVEKLQDQYGSKGFKVLVIAIDETGEKAIKPYFAEHPTTLTVILDMYKVTAEKYGVKSLPSTFLIDPNGKIALTMIGYKEDTIKTIAALLATSIK
jgi:thiol-disulfide isomerase/thioredoxin